jgi:hypothetical protein
MASSPTVICKECGHENETERVYCHNCGIKLNRDVLLQQQQRQMLSPEEAQRRVRKMMSPRSAIFTRTAKGLIKALGYAVLTAALIQIVRPPEGAFDISKKGELIDMPPIDTILETLTAAPAGRQHFFQEAEVNAYLKRETFKKVPAWLTSNVPLRDYVNFDNGSARFNVVGSFLGYPIYVGAAFRFEANGAVLKPVYLGGYIGRLPIPAVAMQYAAPAIPALLGSFPMELKLANQLGNLQFEKGRVILTARGTGAGAGVPTLAAPIPAKLAPVRPAGF